MTDNNTYDTPQTKKHNQNQDMSRDSSRNSAAKHGDDRKKGREERRRMLADLRANMETALTISSKGGDPAAELEKQMDVLNAVFMRLLADADDKWDMQSQYALALRAQNQFRKTYQVVENGRNVKKRLTSAKSGKRTESKSLK